MAIVIVNSQGDDTRMNSSFQSLLISRQLMKIAKVTFAGVFPIAAVRQLSFSPFASIQYTVYCTTAMEHVLCSTNAGVLMRLSVGSP
jgi:hypothetical protein